MAKENLKTIEDIVKKFIRKLKRKYRIEAVYWFGSTAHGDDHEYSDIDVAVVSPDFSGFRFKDARKLAPLVIKTDLRIEVHPYSSKKFKERPFFVKEVLRTGKRMA